MSVQCTNSMRQSCEYRATKKNTAIYKDINTPWASYQIRKIAGCACAGNAGNVFPRGRLQRKPLASDPDMHHGTCVTHVPWCMSGSLTHRGGENVPGIPGACAPAILCIWQEAHWSSDSWVQIHQMNQIILHTFSGNMFYTVLCDILMRIISRFLNFVEDRAKFTYIFKSIFLKILFLIIIWLKFIPSFKFPEIKKKTGHD